MKSYRKLFSLIMMLLIMMPVLFSVSQTVYAEGGEETEEYKEIPAAGTLLYDAAGTAYCVSDADYDSASVMYAKAPKGTAGTVVVPDTIELDGFVYIVNGIDEKAFYKQRKLTKVVIGSNVERIWNDAFAGCKALKSVVMNKKIEIIDDRAFRGCTSLNKIVVPETVWMIGSGAFSGCKGLKTVKMGSGLKEIWDGAFENCTALRSIVIPKNVKSIGYGAFIKCGRLKSITIQSTKLRKGTVAEDAFSGIAAKAVIKCPKSKRAAYKKLFLTRGAKKTCRFK